MRGIRTRQQLPMDESDLAGLRVALPSPIFFISLCLVIGLVQSPAFPAVTPYTAYARVGKRARPVARKESCEYKHANLLMSKQCSQILFSYFCCS